MAVTLLNVFIVPADKHDEFLTEWTKSATHFSKQEGFIETHLHKNSGVGNQTFQYINIARWASADAWHRLHDDYKPTEYTIAGVKGHPAIFDSIIDMELNKGDASRPIRW